MQLWNLRRPREAPAVFMSTSAVSSIAFAAHAKMLAAGLDDGTVQLLRADGLKPAGKPVAVAGGAAAYVALGPDGRRIAAATSADTAVSTWDIDRRTTFGRTIPAAGVADLAFSPDGRTLAVAEGYDGVLLVRGRGTPVPLLARDSDGSFEDVAFSGDGKVLAGSSNDGSIQLWKLPGGDRAGRLPAAGALGSQKLALDMTRPAARRRPG